MEYILALVTASLAFSIFYFGSRSSGYSHVNHTISELAATGSKDSALISYGVFLPIGLASAFVAYATREHEGVFLLASSLAVGYLFAALFPIDKNAPTVGTWKNILHNITGGISYILAMLGFETLGQQAEGLYVYGKYFIAAFIVSLFIPWLRDFRGLLQRIAEVVIFVALITAV